MPPITVGEDVDLEKQDGIVSDDLKADTEPPTKALPTVGVVSEEVESKIVSVKDNTEFNSPVSQQQSEDSSDKEVRKGWKSLDPWPPVEGKFKKHDYESGLHIIEVASNGDLLKRLSINHRDFSDKHCVNISKSLSMPPAVGSILLITLDLYYRTKKYSNVIDALNSSLQIDPSLWLTCERLGTWETPQIQPFKPSFCVIGPFVAIIKQRLAPNGASANVILVVRYDLWDDQCIYHLWSEEDSLPIILESEEREDIEDVPPHVSTLLHFSSRDLVDMYTCLLHKEIQTGRLQEIAKHPFKTLYPLIELQIWAMRAKTRFNRAKYLAKSSSGKESNRNENSLFKSRRIFRRSIEGFVDSNKQFVRYVTSFSSYDDMNDNHMKKLERDFDYALGEAQSLDLEIRDFLQLYIGHASLEESRKSIQLAKVQSEVAEAQMEESKRAKIVTVLAFVFVPLNLVTSIFGMNLEELNGSGKSLGVFFANAVGLTIFTFACWALEIQRMRFIKWKEKAIRDRNERYYTYRHGAKFRTRTGLYHPSRQLIGVFFPDLLGRLQLLYWAVSHGLTYWLWKNGAIIPILTADLCGSFKILQNNGEPDSAVDALYSQLVKRKNKNLQRRYHAPDNWNLGTPLTRKTPLKRI